MLSKIYNKYYNILEISSGEVEASTSTNSVASFNCRFVLQGPANNPFELLPVECAYAIFSQLTIEDRKVMSLTSKYCKAFIQTHYFKGLHFRKISKSRCKEIINVIQNYNLMAITPSQIHLNELHWLRDEHVLAMCAHLKNPLNIIDLSLEQCFSLTDCGIQPVLDFENLVNLDLSHCYDINGLSLFHSSSLKNLRFLDLSWCVQLKTESFANWGVLPNLKALMLQGCTHINDTDIIYILISAPNLKVLDLSWCIHITDNSIPTLKAFKKIKIYLEGSGITKEGHPQLEACSNLDVCTIPDIEPKHKRKILPQFRNFELYDQSLLDRYEFKQVHKAVLMKDIETVQQLLADGIDINAISKNKWTALHVGAYVGCLELVDLLIQKGADITLINEGYENSIHVAIRKGHTEVAIFMINQIPMDSIASTWDFPIVPIVAYAVKYENLEVLKLLIHKGADLFVEDASKNTLLHEAAKCGSSKTLRFLIDYGLNVNAKNDFKLRPIDYSLKFDFNHLAGVLIAKGAAINDTSYVKTTLQEVAQKGNEKLAHILIAMGADKQAQSIHGWTAVHEAAQKNRLAALKILSINGCDLSKRNTNDETALWIALCKRNLEAYNLLIELGAERISLFEHMVKLYRMINHYINYRLL